MGQKDGFVDMFMDMQYIGRDLMFFKTIEGVNGFAYILQGRSVPSQARVLEAITANYWLEEKGQQQGDFSNAEKIDVIRTEVTEEKFKKGGSPILLYYPAAIFNKEVVLVSNGSQTMNLFNAYMDNPTLPAIAIAHDAFKGYGFRFDPVPDSKTGLFRLVDDHSYEPDFSHNTSRISGVMKGDNITIHLVRKNMAGRKEEWGKQNVLNKGDCYSISTYEGNNEEPRLVPFQGNEPKYTMMLSTRPEEILENIKSSISHGTNPGDNYGVSAVVVLLDGKTPPLIYNRNKKVLEK